MGIADAGTNMTLYSAALATILMTRAFMGHLLCVPRQARKPHTSVDVITDDDRRAVTKR
jgi:hypothetical protein